MNATAFKEYRIYRHQFGAMVLLCAVTICCFGCKKRLFKSGSPYPAVPVQAVDSAGQLPNPLTIPVLDQEFAWSQLIDEMEDYFRIRQSERVRLVDNVYTDGWLETYPQIGSTLFEGWRRDSTKGFEKLHATLQTIRRWARVRVIPTSNGYQFDVQVYKELEDLESPDSTVANNESSRYSTTPHFNGGQPGPNPNVYGWIPLGRDVSLEQRILQRLRARLTQQP